MTDYSLVRGNEFIKRVRKLAKARGVRCTWHANLGKGSHGVLILGEQRSVVHNPKDELKTGTFHAMLKQLGIDEDDL